MTAFEDLFKSLRIDRGVNRAAVVTAIEAALLAAYRSSPDAKSAAYARAQFDAESGAMWVERLVDLHSGDLPRPGVDVVDGPNGREIAVVDWETLPDAERETVELDPARFGRVAAMAAKDALRREVRTSEQRVVQVRYAGRVGALVEGIVGERFAGGVLVTLDDGAEAVLPFGERRPGPMPRLLERLAAVITSVAVQSDGPQITLSETDPRLVKAIFADEIAEVADGRIEVRVARRPGIRSKVAVSYRKDERAVGSAVGACVGERGSRIRRIRDLLGEELDLLAYDDDPLVYVTEALKPAKARNISATADGFLVVVTEDEQRKAIGEDGVGLELAQELIGKPIELRVETAASAETAAEEAAASGTCAYIRPNGKRCPNAAEPDSKYCGLPAHKAAA